MNDRPSNSAVHPSVRAGLETMIRDAAEHRAKAEAAETERLREHHARRERDAATMRQSLEAFRAR